MVREADMGDALVLETLPLLTARPLLICGRFFVIVTV
jgi:hypothetical protein